VALIGTSLTANVYSALYTAQVSNADISVSSSTAQGRVETILDFNAGEGVNSRDIETAFSWPISQGTILYVWQPSWINFPENSYDRNSDWMPVAGGGAGFVQGIIVEADTFNVPKVFQLQDSDTLAFHTLNEVGTGIAFNRQSIKAFSCTTPFVAHLVRVTTDDGVAWRVWNNNIVAQPFPESTISWQTELTSLGGTGWNHLRLINLEYISTAAATLSFVVDTENGSYAPQSIVLPSTGGTQTKFRVTPTANKWKLISFNLTSTAPVVVFQEGQEFWTRSWGASSEYRKAKPFGGQSLPAATV
jgi:hypothetical protein